MSGRRPDRDRDRPVLVIVSRQRIVGATNGSSAYVIALARTMREAGFAVHLVQPSAAIAGRTPFYRLGTEMAVFDRHVVRGARRVGRWLLFGDARAWTGAVTGTARRLARKAGLRGGWTADRPRPYAVATEWTRAQTRYVARHLPGSVRAVIADYVFATPAFAAAPPGVATGTIMHDLFHAREGGIRDSVASLDRDAEIAMLGRADAVIAIQQRERAFVERCAPGVRALLAPMPAHPRDDPQPGEDGTLLFIGSGTAPNVEGLRWFLAECWPAIRARHPNAELAVAGTVGRAFAGERPPGVRFLGMVADLDPLYAQAAVVVSPLTFGSGLKIKLIEGLAQGKAMVVSGVTLQGVEAECAGSVRRADDPDDFTRHVDALLFDRAARMALGARALEATHRHFAPGPAHAELRDWLDTLR